MMSLPALTDLLVEVRDKVREIHNALCANNEPEKEENALRESYNDAIQDALHTLENPNLQHSARVCAAIPKLRALLEDEVPF